MVLLWSYSILLLVFLLSVFSFKISSNLFSQQRRFFFYALVSMIFWGVFNFAFVNSSSLSSALAFYSLMMLSVSVMSGLFLLNTYSFIASPGFLVRLVATSPSFSLLVVFPFLRIVSAHGAHEAVLNAFFLLWLAVCTAVLSLSLFFILSVSERVVKKRIKKKVKAFSVIMAVITASVIFSFLLNFSSFSFLLSSFALLLSYPLFR